MKPFDTLTPAGQCRRLHLLARQALAAYPLRITATTPLAVDTNTLFKVSAAEGTFVLRVSLPEQRSLLEIQSELAWLAALRRDTTLEVPEPVPTSANALVVTARAPGVPEPRHCVLFRWIEGRFPGDQLAAPTAYQAGALLARLHNHADSFVPPQPFSSTRLDQAWPFGAPEGLTSAAPDPLWPPERRDVFHEAAALVQTQLDRLYAEPAELRFLHLDFHPGNLKQLHGRLAVLDFDDTRWAYPVQDLGNALYYLFDEPGYAVMREHMLAGYASARRGAVPSDAELDVGILARQLDLLSYVCATNLLEGADLAEWLDTVERRVRMLMPVFA